MLVRLIGARRTCCLAAAFAVCTLQPRHVDARVASTREERARFVALVRLLENDPLAENASATRQQLQQWVIDVPDIRFAVCPGLLGETLGTGYPYAREINYQVLLSGAVLTIEDRGRARDDVAVYSAGVEGALHAYEALRGSRPDAQLQALDDLIRKRDRGVLVDHIARLADEHCERSNPMLIAAPIGAAAGLVLALLVAHWFGRRGPPVPANPSGPPAARTMTIFREVVFICVAYYAIAGIALHVLEPDYDPRFQFMSDYAWGAYGWLMTTTFFVLALAVFTIALGLRDVHHSSWSARTGFGLLAVAALFVCLAGVFRGFPLHDVASAVAIPGLAMAVLLLSWSFRNAAGWQALHPASMLIAAGMAAAVVSMVAGAGMPGLQQRAFFCLLLSWLAIVVHRLVRVAGTSR